MKFDCSNQLILSPNTVERVASVEIVSDPVILYNVCDIHQTNTTYRNNKAGAQF